MITGRSDTRRFSRALGAALLLALLAGGQTASAGLHPTEARYHLDFARLPPEAEPPVDGADGDMPPPPHPEASLIERRWYTDEGLADALDEGNLRELEMVAGITSVLVDGVLACRWVASPLLGEDFEDLCISEHPRLVKILAKIIGGDADCSFDATFGEPCFDDQPRAHPPTSGRP